MSLWFVGVLELLPLRVGLFCPDYWKGAQGNKGSPRPSTYSKVTASLPELGRWVSGTTAPGCFPLLTLSLIGIGVPLSLPGLGETR